jgi:hypothetical protein
VGTTIGKITSLVSNTIEVTLAAALPILMLLATLTFTFSPRLSLLESLFAAVIGTIITYLTLRICAWGDDTDRLRTVERRVAVWRDD